MTWINQTSKILLEFLTGQHYIKPPSFPKRAQPTESTDAPDTGWHYSCHADKVPGSLGKLSKQQKCRMSTRHPSHHPPFWRPRLPIVLWQLANLLVKKAKTTVCELDRSNLENHKVTKLIVIIVIPIPHLATMHWLFLSVSFTFAYSI